LPIHILELLKCADSSILYTLIRSYPKVLYTVRAFTHALAYFNSCLNPYLYALLNRNFCFDLIDITPICSTCWKQSDLLQIKNYRSNIKVVSSPILSNEIFFKKKLHNDDDEDDDDEIYYHEKIQLTNIDLACQAQLLGR
jgi:hypothetical protein